MYDACDDDLVRKYSWCAWAPSPTSTPYAVARVDGKVVKLHRLLVNAGQNDQIDHANLNSLDNRRHNLRLASAATNAYNKGKYARRVPASSKFKGVSFHKASGKWASRIIANRRSVSLGLHDNETDAAIMYNLAALKYHGEFARLNNLE